jgi:hypothetical protein
MGLNGVSNEKVELKEEKRREWAWSQKKERQDLEEDLAKETEEENQDRLVTQQPGTRFSGNRPSSAANVKFLPPLPPPEKAKNQKEVLIP